MKKTIFATLALGTALTFGGLEHKADASEIDYNTLAEKAKSNSTELIQQPIQEGNYDFSFVEDGYTFHFYNYNGNFGYDYHQGTDGQVENTSSKLASQEQVTPEQKVDQQQVQFDKQNVLDKQEPNTTTAPATENTKQPTQSTSKSSSGTPAGMEGIVARESGGDPTAVNPSSGASGKYQFLQSTWDSVAPSQYKGVSPAKVPESVQDQVASKLWNGGAGASHWADTV